MTRVEMPYRVIAPAMPQLGSSFRLQRQAIAYAALVSTMFGHAIVTRRGRLLTRLRGPHPWAVAIPAVIRRVTLPGELP